MKKNIFTSLILLLVFTNSKTLFSQVATIANYDFNSGSSYTTFAPVLATGISCAVSSSESFITFTGAASGSQAFTSNFTAGQAMAMNNSSGTNTKYFSFNFTGTSLTYYTAFKVYFQAQRSNTGAALVTLQYRLNNTGPYVTFGTMAPGNGSFSQSGVINLPAAVDNPTTSLEIRLYASGASASGTLRMDNFQVQALPVAKLSIGNNGSQPVAADIYKGTSNNILQTFSITEGNLAAATLTNVSIPLSGNYTAGEISASGLKLFANTTNNFATATLLSSKNSSSAGAGETVTFNALNYAIAKNTARYFWLTADISAGATPNKTINASALTINNFQFSSGIKTGPVSAAGIQTIKGLTQIQAAYCGYTAASYGESIPADIIAGATGYEFKLVNTALSYTQTIVNPSGNPHLNLYLLSGLINNTTYTTTVRYFNGVTWSAYGNACSISTPVSEVTALKPAHCGNTVSSYDEVLSANPVSGATQYEFKLENATLGYSQTYVKPQPNFNLTQFTGLNNATTYSVSVRVFFNNAWQNYGSLCTIITPADLPTTSLSSINCNITATSYSQILFADAVNGATQYEYKLENNALAYSQSYVKTNNNFNLTQFSGLTNGTTYSVSVRVKLNNTWGAYGAVCNITTPSTSPTTALQASYCNFTAPSFSTVIFATVVAGATQYEYLLTNTLLSYSQSYVKPQPNFNLTQFTGLTQNTTYNVQVRAFFNNTWGPYGSICNVTTPNTTPPSIASSFMDELVFTERSVDKNSEDNNSMASLDVLTYPNPFNNEFKIHLVSYTVNEPVSIRVFDATGKLLEEYKLTPGETENISLGSHYINGIYNIVISQNSKTKTVRAVKN